MCGTDIGGLSLGERDAGFPEGRGIHVMADWLECHGPRMRATQATYLYIGVTNDLARRCWEHREGVMPGFTKRYGVKLLVYYEVFEDIEAAIRRETRLKKYKRKWKLNLIEGVNPGWLDLAMTLRA